MNSDHQTRDQNKYTVRFPDGMRDRISQEADANGRSINAEIVERLAASLKRPSIEAAALDEIRADLAEIKARIRPQKPTKHIDQGILTTTLSALAAAFEPDPLPADLASLAGLIVDLYAEVEASADPAKLIREILALRKSLRG